MSDITAISNEKILAALSQYKTIEKAATAIGITPCEIHNCLKDREFRKSYAEFQRKKAQNSFALVNNKLSEAINTVTEIMNDTENSSVDEL